MKMMLLFGALLLATPVIAAPIAFGVGDIVFRREIKEALPNALGGKDIFGRRRTVGLIELRYIGFDGKTAVFARRDTRILTNENTMNRSGAVIGSVGESSVFMTGLGVGPTIQPLAPSEIAVRVDLEADRTIIVDGVTIEVISATTNKVIVDVPPAAKR